jgi:uncharacterized phiE125 gp8 family phage protein
MSTWYAPLATWGTFGLTVTSPVQSFIEPITLAEVKNWLRYPDLSPANSDDDNDLLSLIAAARSTVELEQGRQLVRKQWDWRSDYWLDYAIELLEPLVSVDLFQYTDSDGVTTTMTAGANYLVDTGKRPGIIVPPYNVTWPTFTPAPSGSILVRFTAGYDASDVWWQSEGAPLKQAMRYLITRWWTERLAGETAVFPAMLERAMRHGARVQVR